MRANLATPTFLALALTMGAQSPDPEQALAKTRDNILERTERLPNYTCVQTVDRKFLKLKKPVFPIPSCDDMSAQRSPKADLLGLQATDRLRLDVQVSDGTEIEAWAGDSHFGNGTMMSLIKGPFGFGTGGFGNFLTDILTGAGVKLYFEGEETVDSLKLFRYRFQISRESSHYMAGYRIRRRSMDRSQIVPTQAPAGSNQRTSGRDQYLRVQHHRRICNHANRNR